MKVLAGSEKFRNNLWCGEGELGAGGKSKNTDPTTKTSITMLTLELKIKLKVVKASIWGQS